MARFTWEKRLERARQLSTLYPFASEILKFYEQIASFQRDIYEHVRAACGDRVEKRASGSLRDELDLAVLLPRFPSFLGLIERAGTSSLAQCARELSTQDSEAWMSLLARYWSANGQGQTVADNSVIFFARAFLQPYAEYLANYTECPPTDARPSICPLCRGKPQVGVLRQEGDGAKRSLICSTCSTEWDYRRIVCAACGEENVDKLPIFTSPQFQHMRVDACDACRMFLITADLTKNGLAIPEVDELASIPLGLWAQENGYVKLVPNLLGM